MIMNLKIQIRMKMNKYERALQRRQNGKFDYRAGRKTIADWRRWRWSSWRLAGERCQVEFGRNASLCRASESSRSWAIFENNPVVIVVTAEYCNVLICGLSIITLWLQSNWCRLLFLYDSGYVLAGSREHDDRARGAISIISGVKKWPDRKRNMPIISKADSAEHHQMATRRWNS